MKQDAQYINTVIDNNKSHFVAGNTINEQALSKWFNIRQPDYRQPTPEQVGKEFTRFNCRKLTMYNKINRVLALRGIKLSSRNYGEEYEVSNITQAQSKVKALNKRAKLHKSSATVLANGISKYGGKWKQLTEAELASI